MKRAGILICVCLLIPLDILFSESPSLRLVNPYYLKSGAAYTALEYGFTDLGGGFLHGLELSLDYGANERVLLGLTIPYFWLQGSEDGGRLGDVGGYGKFLLTQTPDLFFRLSAELSFRFPTGVLSADASRSLENGIYSYYPFSTGCSMMSFALVGTFIVGDFFFWCTAIYASENTDDESLADFNLTNDHADLQLGGDINFKIPLDAENRLFIRPAVFLQYQQNLSDAPLLPSAVRLQLECNFRLNYDWQWTVSGAIPLWQSDPLYSFQIRNQIGRYF